MQAIHSTRPGGHVGFVGASHDVAIPGDELFMAGVHIHGGPAPVRQYLPELIQLIWDRKIDPGKVFDLTLPLEVPAARSDNSRGAARRPAPLGGDDLRSRRVRDVVGTGLFGYSWRES